MNVIIRQTFHGFVLCSVVLLVGLFAGSGLVAGQESSQLNLGPVIPVSPPGAFVHAVLMRASVETENGVLMVCGSRRFAATNSVQGFVYVSYDAGRTWQETLVDQ